MSGTKLNALALYTNFVVMALLGFIVSPFLVHYLGAANFGIWKSCQRILDLSSVADGRATQALKWIIAHQSASEDDAKRQREIGAALVIWLMWLPFLLVAVGLVVYALPSLINGVHGEQVGLTRWVGAILGANVILTALLTIPDAVLFGINQAYRSVVLTTFYMVLSNVGMLAGALMGFGLLSLPVIVLACAFLNGFTTWLVVRKRVSWWGIRRPQRGDITRFLGFSNWTLVWALVQTLLLSTEMLVIAFLIDSITVTKYSFSSYVVQFALSMALMTGSAVTPRLGALVGSGSLAAASKIIRQTRELLIGVITVSASGLILFNHAFVSSWIGPDYFLGDTVNILMAIAFAQLALFRFDAQLQDVGLNIRTKVLIALFGAVAGLFLAGTMYFLFHSIVWLYVGLIIGRIPATLLLPRLLSQMVPGSSYEWRPLLAMIGIVTASVLVLPFLDPQGWLQLLPIAALGMVLIVGLTYALVLTEETRLRLSLAGVGPFARYSRS